MITITIAKSVKKGDLVAISREEYEELLSLKKIVPIFKPSPAELKALARGEKELALGEFRPWSKFKHDLANFNRKRRAKAA